MQATFEFYPSPYLTQLNYKQDVKRPRKSRGKNRKLLKRAAKRASKQLTIISIKKSKKRVPIHGFNCHGGTRFFILKYVLEWLGAVLCLFRYLFSVASACSDGIALLNEQNVFLFSNSNEIRHSSRNANGLCVQLKRDSALE
ncbi:hypothetical protein SAMN04489868_1461 [Pisciglobus halotolerans]|uniref:Uncharacterized protein n=1 Tax=Pisciglobus halotolerans TaxID=745365 RepID=A0A1I3DNZ4_9LACT|nr:hypothetical protein SAMN04489868_1461 [Pisciglobus halotolerans]